MNIPRMRTAKEIAREFKEADPKTCVSESSIRRLGKEGKIETVQIGRKHLFDLDCCIDYFKKTQSASEKSDESPDSPMDEDRLNLFKKRIGCK